MNSTTDTECNSEKMLSSVFLSLSSGITLTPYLLIFRLMGMDLATVNGNFTFEILQILKGEPYNFWIGLRKSQFTWDLNGNIWVSLPTPAPTSNRP